VSRHFFFNQELTMQLVSKCSTFAVVRCRGSKSS